MPSVTVIPANVQDDDIFYNILYNILILYILVGEEYEGLSEQLNLQSKCFLHLLILREDLSSSQLSVIQTEYSIICIMFIAVYYSLKMLYNN